MKISIIGRFLTAVLEPGESVSYSETKKESACKEKPSGAVLSIDERKRQQLKAKWKQEVQKMRT